MATQIADAKIIKIKELADRGIEQKAIAKMLGVSGSTVSKYVRKRHIEKVDKIPHEKGGAYRSYGQRKAEEFIAAGGAKVEIDPAGYFDRKRK